MSEFDFKDKTKHSNSREELMTLLKVVMFVGAVCAFYGALNWSFSAVKERTREIRESKKQEKNVVDTTKTRNYMNNTHQIVIFQDTAKTK